MKSEAFAPAKINLTLHVTGQRPDGYHLLDSLVVFADVGDRLWFDPRDDLAVEVSGPFAEGVPTDRRNLVWRAAEEVGFKGLIRLEKNLPHGAGIGGGSADAAAVLRTFGGAEAAAGLGADVPVCLSPQFQRMQGIGDRLASLPAHPRLDLVLVNPRVSVPTAEVFAALSSKANAPMPDHIPTFRTVGDMSDWLRAQRNDLEPPARALFPEIGRALASLDDALVARMSGSGSTCFGLYEDAEAAARRIAAAHPNWWVTRAKTFQQGRSSPPA